jgi:3',5'-cyclic AMP phosphodiesterase CpdA
VLDLLRPRYAGLVWVPGNHDLWTMPGTGDQARGEERYAHYLDVCREYDVVTPEDPYPVVDGTAIVPLFTLYDYSFREPGTTKAQALAAAEDAGAFGADEVVLHPDPHPSREAWCHARVAATERRLETELDPGTPTVLVGHWPLRHDTVRLPLVPLYSPWCGTTLTEDWHVRFRARAVVSGHLHVPGTLWRDGVPFQEVSLGYPRQWQFRLRRGVEPALQLVK